MDYFILGCQNFEMVEYLSCADIIDSWTVILKSETKHLRKILIRGNIKDTVGVGGSNISLFESLKGNFQPTYKKRIRQKLGPGRTRFGFP